MTPLAISRASRARTDTRVASGSSSHRPVTPSKPKANRGWLGAAILSPRKQAHLPGSLARIQRGEPICVPSAGRVLPARRHRSALSTAPPLPAVLISDPAGSFTTLHDHRAADS